MVPSDSDEVTLINDLTMVCLTHFKLLVIVVYAIMYFVGWTLAVHVYFNLCSKLSCEMHTTIVGIK